MAINAKLGCLKSSQRMPSSSAPAGYTKWRDEYICNILKFERPEKGVSRVDLPCPTCGRPLAFHVESANRVQIRFLVMAIVGTAAVLGIGCFLLSNWPTHKTGRLLGLGLIGVGGLGLAVTLVLGLTKPGIFDIAAEALSVSHAGERPLELAPGIAGTGHRLLEVWKNRAEIEIAAAPISVAPMDGASTGGE
jgi:hypothetical protein